MNFVLEDAAGKPVHTEPSDAVFTRPKEVPLVRYKGTIYAPYQFLYAPAGDAFTRVHCREAPVIDICATAMTPDTQSVWLSDGQGMTYGPFVLPTTTTVTFVTNGDPTVRSVSVANTQHGEELVSDRITAPAACFLCALETKITSVTLDDTAGHVLTRKHKSEIPPKWHFTRHDSLTVFWSAAAAFPEAPR